jgi:hypothetical protein
MEECVIAGKSVITKGKDDKYYFNLKAGNGEVVLIRVIRPRPIA